MAERYIHPEWRAQHEHTPYPFAERATLTNGRVTVLDGMFLDAAIHPVGAQPEIYLSQVRLTHRTAEVAIGDARRSRLATSEFSLLDPPDHLPLTDAQGRAAGLLVSESQQLAALQSWGVGTHEFRPAQTAFAAVCCTPTPEVGVRGIQLEDGTLLTGDVWLVGGDGVVLRQSEARRPPVACGEDPRDEQVIRVDVVGDPLFRRRLCADDALFETPRLVRQLTFTDGQRTFVCEPGEQGDVQLLVGNELAEDTILRIRATPDGVVIEAVGSELQSLPT